MIYNFFYLMNYLFLFNTFNKQFLSFFVLMNKGFINLFFLLYF